MEQIYHFSDQLGSVDCIPCLGENHSGRYSRDHIPTRALLNPPYPENLMDVGMCQECNSGFSKDEEYFAAFLASVISGMECSIAPMGGSGADASRFRAEVGAKLQECLGITMSEGELAKLWVTSNGAMELSGFIREHLDSRVGVASFSRDALNQSQSGMYI